MDVRLCRRCKKMFQYISGPEVCPKCKQKEEEMFEAVKEYLRNNPGASMTIISDETGVPVSLIESFLRQGRLEVTGDSPIALTCETCGTKIYTGRFCMKCSSSMADKFSDAAKQMTQVNKQAEPSNKMRFLKSDRIK